MYSVDDTAQLVVPVTEADHIEGPDDAPVTLVEYGDFECPYCGRAYPMIKDLRKRFGNELRFVFRNFPIPESHPHAEEAAEAAEAAGAQGKFWEMHDCLYEHQGALDEPHLAQYARILSLDAAEFERELETGELRQEVEEDVEGGLASGVQGTPTFFINGIRYDGPYDEESLAGAIQAAGAR